MNKINYKALLLGFTIIATIIVGYFGLEFGSISTKYCG